MGSGIRPKKDFSRHQKDMVRAGLQQSLNPDTQSPESTISEAPTQGLLASASKDIHSQDRREGAILDNSLLNPVPDTRKGCGKIISKYHVCGWNDCCGWNDLCQDCRVKDA